MGRPTYNIRRAETNEGKSSVSLTILIMSWLYDADSHYKIMIFLRILTLHTKIQPFLAVTRVSYFIIIKTFT